MRFFPVSRSLWSDVFCSRCCSQGALATAADTPPNILLILADDMGSGNIQALNPESKIPTPHLNTLAS